MRAIYESSSKLSKYLKQIFTSLVLIFMGFASFAQRMDQTDNHSATTEFNYDSREAAWYTQPWIWAIVAAILILIIAYASKGYLRRHRESDSETGITH